MRTPGQPRAFGVPTRSPGGGAGCPGRTKQSGNFGGGPVTVPAPNSHALLRQCFASHEPIVAKGSAPGGAPLGAPPLALCAPRAFPPPLPRGRCCTPDPVVLRRNINWKHTSGMQVEFAFSELDAWGAPSIAPGHHACTVVVCVCRRSSRDAGWSSSAAFALSRSNWLAENVLQRRPGWQG